MWLIFVLIYALMKGIRDILKKFALNKSSLMQVLFTYTVFSFIMAIPQAPDAFKLEKITYIFPIIAKAAILFIAWLANFYSITKMPLSLFGVLDLSRVVFSTLYGVILLDETMSLPQIIGLVVVCCGLLMLKAHKKEPKLSAPEEKLSAKSVVIALIGCGFTAFSGALDKMIMKTGNITSSQLLFWYCFFLMIFYFVYMVIKKEKFEIKATLKNYWIYLMSLSLVIGDRLLFIANTDPACKVTLMTLIKQSSCIVIILGGKFIFKEKKVLYKLLCALIIIIGIAVALIPA